MDEIQLYLTPLTNNLEQLRAVSQNVSNINTPGYNAQSFASSFDGSQTLVHKVNGHSVRSTGQELNFAITGKAFFLIEKDSGRYITKNGSFHIDASKQLTHISGGKLLVDGAPMNLQGTEFSVSSTGEVSEDGKVIGKINLVEPTTNAQLRPAGDGLYQLTEGGLLDVEGEVTQGAINTSNVNPAYEMSRLLQLSRHTESLQKAAQTYNEMLSKGISDIGGK